MRNRQQPHPDAAPRRRRIRPRVAAALAALAALFAATIATMPAALAQSRFPERPVKLIVNFPPGGPLDILARTLGEKMQGSLGQPMVVENKPGAGGNIGADLAAKSAADGYTVLVTIDTPFTINPGIYKSLPFKPGDMKPLMTITSSGLMIGTHPGVGAATLAEFIAKGRSEPLTFANAGNGSPGHMAAAILSNATGVKTNHIAYRGNAPAVLAIVSGEVQAGILATPGLLPQAKAGKITALAVTSPQRSELAPELPTVAQAGLKDLEFEVLYLAMVPAATPQPVVDVLVKAMGDALALPDVKARLSSLDMAVLNETGTAASERLARLRERYAKTIAATGMQLE